LQQRRPYSGVIWTIAGRSLKPIAMHFFSTHVLGRFDFINDHQLFVCTHNETLSVAHDSRAGIADDWRMVNDPARMASTITAYVMHESLRNTF
jgi:hypothetical protein